MARGPWPSALILWRAASRSCGEACGRSRRGWEFVLTSSGGAESAGIGGGGGCSGLLSGEVTGSGAGVGSGSNYGALSSSASSSCSP